jgi:hypothetical protein
MLLFPQEIIEINIEIQLNILKFISIFGIASIVYFIINNHIPKDWHFNKKFFDYLHALQYPEIRQLLISHQMSLSQWMNLNPFQLRMIQKLAIRQLIANHIITSTEIVRFKNMEQIYTLQHQPIHQALLERSIHIQPILRMTLSQLRALRNPELLILINLRALTLEEIQQMNPTHLQILRLPTIRELLLNGRININQILNYRLIEFTLIRNQHLFFAQNHQRPENQTDRIVINHSQSTHTTSIHESTSKSASNLLKRYKHGLNVSENILKLQNEILELPEDFKTNAAKRCINRISKPHYQFIDPKSKISIHTLLGLIYCAIHDESQLICSSHEAVSLIVEGLYEIQRGRNINEHQVDDMDIVDKFICQGGVFNKLIEKLNVIHPDIEMVFISLALASLKLPKVIQKITRKFLNDLSSPMNCQEFLRFTQVIADFNIDGYYTIWPHILLPLSDLIFEEFKSLFESKNSVAFQQFIDSGKDSPAIDFAQFQKNIFLSKGYRNYCSEILKQSNGFFVKNHPPADSHFALTLKR